jgi:hypothetical protein
MKFHTKTASEPIIAIIPKIFFEMENRDVEPEILEIKILLRVLTILASKAVFAAVM